MSDPAEPPSPAEVPALDQRGFGDLLRGALAGEQHDYTSGNLKRAVWLLAVPMVLELLMESVFAVYDIFWLGRLGNDAVAAVGMTESMLTIVYAIAIGLAMSGAALVARRIGEKNVDGAVRAATAAIVVGVIGGIALGIPGMLFAGDLLRLMEAPESVIETGTGYARIILGLNVVVMLLHIHNAIFRGAGDASMAMRSLWLANIINMVLDPCLIFGWGPFPALGTTGAAIATTIGRGTGVIYQLVLLRKGRSRIHLRGPAVRIRFPLIVEILRLSFGSIGQLIIATTSWVVLMRLVAPFGEEPLAGYTIAIRIVVFVFLPAWGLSNAAATLVGQNLGAGKPDRSERAVWLTGYYNMLFLGAASVVFVALAPRLIAIFTEDPETIRIGASALRIISYAYVFYAWGMVAMQGFNGAGDTMTPTWINLFCFWTFQLPLAWFLSRSIEQEGVFWAVCIAETVLATVTVLLFRRGRWKEQELAADVPEA